MPRCSLTLTSNASRHNLDTSADVERAVRDSGVQDRLVCVSVPHCTCAVYVNENERGLLADTLRFMAECAAGGHWEHDHIDGNAGAHLVASVLGSSVCLPIVGGKPHLGTWQRVLLIELDGPRQRRVDVTVIAE